MRGASHVVAGGFQRVTAQEDAAGVLDLREVGPGIGNKQTEVLRGVLVRQVQGTLHARYNDDPAPLFERLAGDFGALQ